MPDNDQYEELEKIKRLLVLLLYYNDVPPLEIAKAASISPNEIYKMVSKKRQRNG